MTTHLQGKVPGHSMNTQLIPLLDHFVTLTPRPLSVASRQGNVLPALTTVSSMQVPHKDMRAVRLAHFPSILPTRPMLQDNVLAPEKEEMLELTQEVMSSLRVLVIVVVPRSAPSKKFVWIKTSRIDEEDLPIRLGGDEFTGIDAV